MRALNAKEHDETAAALGMFQKAAVLARGSCDLRLALRMAVNTAALLSDMGRVDDAIKVALEVQTEAAASGLALPEMMALGNLASVAAMGADIRDPLGPLGPLARIIALREVHVAAVAKHELSVEEAKFETADTGTIANELAIFSQNHCAFELAADYFRKSIEIARSANLRFELVNRLAGLIATLVELGDKSGADLFTAEIRQLVSARDLPVRGAIVGQRAIGAHLVETNRPAAISHLQHAMDAVVQMRGRLPPGLARSGFDRQFWDMPFRLSELLLKDNRDDEAFDVLQQAKGRRLIEVLAAKPGASTSGPLTANEAHGLIERAGAGTVLVDLMVLNEALTAFVLANGHTRTVHVAGDLSALRAAESGDLQEREAHAVSLCLENKMLAEMAQRVCEIAPPGARLMIVPDRMLHNLPLHAIPVQGKPWMDRTPIGYSPTGAILRFMPRAGRGHVGALVAGDSRQDLPGAEQECINVAAALGTTALLGPACSRAAIERALRTGRPDVVHLAVHGRGDPRFGGRSSLLLANDDGDARWVDFESLSVLPWEARVVVFSGCSTGLLDRQHGYELLSIANAALESGAVSVVASLWPVNDLYAKEFMVAFYHAFQRARQSGPADLRVILNEARHAAVGSLQKTPDGRRRDGSRHFAKVQSEEAGQLGDLAIEEALHWASFCLFGAPVIEA
ncbi:CHAT domain-containing protein [Burkholderia sp. YR290]|nr:CHAT domain-containing protein [Burkholderia sp. YR290]